MLSDEEYTMHKAHATAVIQELLDTAYQHGLSQQARSKSCEDVIRADERAKCCIILDEFFLPREDRTIDIDEVNDPMFDSIINFQTKANQEYMERIIEAVKETA